MKGHIWAAAGHWCLTQCISAILHNRPVKVSVSNNGTKKTSYIGFTSVVLVLINICVYFSRLI